MAGKNNAIWFITGSQDLYGEETLKQVAEQSKKVVGGLNGSPEIPVEIIWKPVVLTSEGIASTLRDAGSDPRCAGVIAWMHTFSPAKMWIRGLSILSKPFAHLHTQYAREIPWNDIDMDYMNLNQSAHGDREFGFIGARMRIRRRVIAGFWQDVQVQRELGSWIRAALGWADSREGRVARFGDNMRDVAVTEGDKVEAQIALGYSVDGYGVGDLAERADAVSGGRVNALVDEYRSVYDIAPALLNDPASMNRIAIQARIEAGMRDFLEEGGFTAFTTNFQNLYGLPQLPGLAVQRLMASGYGFGAEGDWKHAAMVRTMKVMAEGISGGTSFMEDYTYHMDPKDPLVLGAHMLEICPTIAVTGVKPKVEVHPLGIGGKDDPARLVFDGAPGNAVNVSVVDMGNRIRLILNEVEAKTPDRAMPKLPVARVLWRPKPDFKTGLEGWILAGGAHHTAYSTALTARQIKDYALIAGLELIRIGDGTTFEMLERDLLLSEAAAGGRR